MAARSPVQPRRLSGSLTASCGPTCSLGVSSKKFTPEQVATIHAWFEKGDSYVSMVRRAAEWPGIKYPIDVKSLRTHHDRHLSLAKVGGRAKKIDSIEVLKTVIAEGFSNSGRWRPTLNDTMRAVQLLNQIQGSSNSNAFDDLMDAIEAAAAGDFSHEDDEAPENAAATGNPDESGADYEG